MKTIKLFLLLISACLVSLVFKDYEFETMNVGEYVLFCALTALWVLCCDSYYKDLKEERKNKNNGNIL